MVSTSHVEDLMEIVEMLKCCAHHLLMSTAYSFLVKSTHHNDLLSENVEFE